MGLFDFFKKKKVEDDLFVIASPLNGTIIPIEEIPDEAFATKIIGDGVGIDPTGDTIYAPCDADDISIFDTNHAISFETSNGLELIVHFGIDTVKLDRALIIETENDSEKGIKKRGMYRMLTQMINQMGLNVVSEGLDDEKHYNLIKEAGVQIGQGYYFSKH